jgi:hypothetical protein
VLNVTEEPAAGALPEPKAVEKVHCEKTFVVKTNKYDNSKNNNFFIVIQFNF